MSATESGFVNIRAFVVNNNKRERKERRWVEALALEQARMSSRRVSKIIDKAEKREMKNRRWGKVKTTFGIKGYNPKHLREYEKYEKQRERARHKNYKYEDLLVTESVERFNACVSSGVHPGTSFEMKFRF